METEKIRNFTLLHFEKLILMLVVGVSGFLVHRGIQHEDILESHQPDRLIAETKRIRVDIDQDRTDKILHDRTPMAPIPKEIKPLPPADPERLLVRPPGPMSPRREDPMLLAPQALQVHGVLAPIALRSTDGQYPLQDLEAADPPKVEQQLRGPKPAPRPNDDGWFEPTEMDIDEDQDAGFDPQVERDNSRRLSNPIGFRPHAVRNAFNNAPQLPVPGVGWFIAGTAVMPNKGLHETYSAALASAPGFDPLRRDRPNFKSYELQRADVTHKRVNQLLPADWIQRDGRTECIKDAAFLWAGFAPEIVPVEYRADETLTMWIPPVMLTDYSLFALHPLIPMLSPAQIKARQAKRPNAIEPEDVIGRIIIDDGILGRPRVEFDPQDMGQRFGNPQLQPKPEPVDYKLIRFYDFAVDSRDANAPKPGHQYIYRLRVAVEDPNFPFDPRLQPRGRQMSPRVFDRVMDSISRVKNAKDPAWQRWQESRRWTPWSQPSDPIALPSPDRVFLGPVAERKFVKMKVGDHMVDYSKQDPSGSAVISRFSAKYSSRMPMLIEEVTAGTVLSKSQEFVDVVDPITLKIKKVPDAKIVTKTTVIDIDGGRALSIHKEDGFTEPGVMLMFSEDGGLKVQDEVDDQESYRIESFADERGR